MTHRIVWLLIAAALFGTVTLACGGPSPSREDCSLLADTKASIAETKLETAELRCEHAGPSCDPYASLSPDEREDLKFGQKCDRIWTCVRESYRSWNECVEWERSY